MASVAAAFELATRSHAEGKLALAEQFALSVLTEEPAHAEALHLLGIIALQKGNASLAVDYLNRSLLCDGHNAVVWKNMGDVYLAAGDLVSGVASYERALRLEPHFADAHDHLGIALQHLGYLERAVASHQEAVRLAPDLARAHNNLANALRSQGKSAEVAAAFEQAHRLAPECPEFVYNLGTALHEEGELERAVDCYRLALRMRPGHADASNNLATALKEQGNLDEAIAQFRQTLCLKPDHASALYNLSELAAVGHYQFAPEELERVKALAQSPRVSALERSLCGFAVASVLDKQKAYDEAFAYYRMANDLRRPQDHGVAFDAARHEAFVDGIIATYDEAYFERVRDWGVDTDLPVFIIGMPRSGSTLVEQILASHPSVFGAGELGQMPQLLAKLAADSQYLNGTPLLPDPRAARDMAAAYLKCLQSVGKGAPRVTIKTLENYLHLGAIATLFPRARIIHCRRDPLDICVSCYCQNFNHLDFTWSLDDIGAYYRAYEKLMAHWDRVLPVRIHEVYYEELIHNQEAVSRDLVSFCDLDWDERCLSFFKTRRVVRTASTVQVRKPISTKSIGRWKHYRSHLGPLLAALGRGFEGGAEEMPAAALPEAVFQGAANPAAPTTYVGQFTQI
jgi:tetratricopeptide (TPR) repeat protein